MTSKFVKERIAELVQKENKSEKCISREMGRSAGYIQSLTSGKSLPSLSMFFEICDYFHISPSEFFTEEISASEQYHRLLEYSARLRPDQTECLIRLMELLAEARQS